MEVALLLPPKTPALPIPPIHPIRGTCPAPAPALHCCISPATASGPYASLLTLRFAALLPTSLLCLCLHSLPRHSRPRLLSRPTPTNFFEHQSTPTSLVIDRRPPAATLVIVSRHLTSPLCGVPLLDQAPRFNSSLTANFCRQDRIFTDLIKHIETSTAASSRLPGTIAI